MLGVHGNGLSVRHALSVYTYDSRIESEIVASDDDGSYAYIDRH